jgi:hypothetical protein
MAGVLDQANAQVSWGLVGVTGLEPVTSSL